MRRIIVALLAACPLALSAAPADWPPGTYGPYVLEEVRVIDGDTLEATVLVWPGTSPRERIRLRGWDTPELRSQMPCERELARRAKEAVASAMRAAERVWLADVRERDNFGRVLGDIVVLLRGGVGFPLGPWLAGQGLARAWDGKAPRAPWCGSPA